MSAPKTTLALLLAFLFAVTSVQASDRTILRGCVVERHDTSVVLATSGQERVNIDTTWLRPDALASALTDCVTVTAVTIDGRYVAESIEAGDEPNEVHAVTNETTADREKAQHRQDSDDKGGKRKD